MALVFERLPDPACWHTAVEFGRQVLWLHSYGGAFTAPDRPAGTVRFPVGDARQPLSLAPITKMPEAITYDPQRHVILLGDGEFGPVPETAWEYTVGGRNIIKSWFNYRKKEREGRRGSPLDDIHVDTWEPTWTRGFINLLAVLVRLVELKPAQAELLALIRANDLITRDELAADGVRWPSGSADRKPLYSLANDGRDINDGVATLL